MFHLTLIFCTKTDDAKKHSAISDFGIPFLGYFHLLLGMGLALASALRIALRHIFNALAQGTPLAHARAALSRIMRRRALAM